MEALNYFCHILQKGRTTPSSDEIWKYLPLHKANVISEMSCYIIREECSYICTVKFPYSRSDTRNLDHSNSQDETTSRCFCVLFTPRDYFPKSESPEVQISFALWVIHTGKNNPHKFVLSMIDCFRKITNGARSG